MIFLVFLLYFYSKILNSILFTDRLHIVPTDVHLYSISQDGPNAVLAGDILHMLYNNVFM